jgi:hypothetical protein
MPLPFLTSQWEWEDGKIKGERVQCDGHSVHYHFTLPSPAFACHRKMTNRINLSYKSKRLTLPFVGPSELWRRVGGSAHRPAKKVANPWLG